jgi:hypothetical protein
MHPIEAAQRRLLGHHLPPETPIQQSHGRSSAFISKNRAMIAGVGSLLPFGPIRA